MENLFAKFYKLKEETEGKSVAGVTSYIKLQKKEGNREFTPFLIDKSSHPNLGKIVKAFLNSDKVKVGYTTIDKKDGEVEPQLKKKSLYLTGGAVRDHLLGKTPKDYNLVTDATTSEIRMILSQNGFTEVKPSQDGDLRKYTSLPQHGRKSKLFYASRWDKKNKEMTITAEVNGQTFEISPLSKSPKSKNFKPDESKLAASIEDDASNRDFTINAMYIPLTKEDGANTELIDPFGGANHLKGGEIKSIGEKFDDRLKEDPLTAHRLINHFNRFGSGDELPEKYMKSVKAFKNFGAVSKDKAKDEFVRGLENADVDSKKYMRHYSDAGLLSTIFPNIQFDPNDMPDDFRNDRWMMAGWILRKNNPQDVRDMLVNGGWTRQEANDVSYLVKMFQWAGDNFDPENFYDMIQTHTGLTKGKIKDFMKMSKLANSKVDDFLGYDSSDLTPYQNSDMGSRKVNPVYVQYLGRTPVCGEFEMVKRNLMTNRWKDMVDRHVGGP
jgi:tRNA nucleotidyltransferase/poly(A) polymerase